MADGDTTEENRFKLAQRCDKTLLISLCEGVRQRFNVRVDKFGSLPVTGRNVVPSSTEAVIKCVTFCTPFCEAYAAGKYNHKEHQGAVKEKLLLLDEAPLSKRRFTKKATATKAAPSKAAQAASEAPTLGANDAAPSKRSVANSYISVPWMTFLEDELEQLV